MNMKSGNAQFRALAKSTISLLSIDGVTQAAEVKQSIRLSRMKTLAKSNLFLKRKNVAHVPEANGSR
jgi:hypothetical protein